MWRGPSLALRAEPEPVRQAVDEVQPPAVTVRADHLVVEVCPVDAAGEESSEGS